MFADPRLAALSPIRATAPPWKSNVAVAPASLLVATVPPDQQPHDEVVHVPVQDGVALLVEARVVERLVDGRVALAVLDLQAHPDPGRLHARPAADEPAYVRAASSNSSYPSPASSMLSHCVPQMPEGSDAVQVMSAGM